METIEKDWGFRTRIHETPTFVLDRLHLKPGGFCTVHYHQQKYNKFYLESGTVQIEEFGTSHGLDLPIGTYLDEKNESKLLNNPTKITIMTLLVKNLKEYVIKPLTIHRFFNSDTLNWAVLYELIYTEVCEEDIVRLTSKGGCTNA